MHERHLEGALPFMLLAGVKNRTVLIIFMAVSIIHFVNLYHNWWFPRITLLVDILSGKVAANILSSLLIVAFSVLLIQYYRGVTK